MQNTASAYLLALHSINGLGPIRLKAVLDYFKDPRLAWEANTNEFQKIGIPRNTLDLLVETRKNLDPQKYMEDIQKMGIKWMTIFDESYPRLLKEIYDPPVILYYKGDLSILNTNCMAVVGTRKMTSYGRSVCEQFVKELVQSNLTIVSGLARGIDSVAHKTAVLMGGQTVAVLGSGLNKIYPSENKGLAEEIINGHGAIISEFPPDYLPIPGNFPIRNRIISGLSIGVLVIEAASDSGSLITVRQGLEQGREVFAVPGLIDLIGMGAMPVTSAQEILDELGLDQIIGKGKVQSEAQLSEDERSVLEILGNESMHIDEVCRALNLPSSKVSANLLKMEITGSVRNLGGGVYCRS